MQQKRLRFYCLETAKPSVPADSLDQGSLGKAILYYTVLNYTMH